MLRDCLVDLLCCSRGNACIFSFTHLTSFVPDGPSSQSVAQCQDNFPTDLSPLAPLATSVQDIAQGALSQEQATSKRYPCRRFVGHGCTALLPDPSLTRPNSHLNQLLNPTLNPPLAQPKPFHHPSLKTQLQTTLQQPEARRSKQIMYWNWSYKAASHQVRLSHKLCFLCSAFCNLVACGPTP